MNKNYSKNSIPLLIFTVMVILLLAACQPAETPAGTATPGTHPAEATVAALQTENADLETQVAMVAEPTQELPPPTTKPTDTRTSTPRATNTPGPTLSIPEESQSILHEAAPGYVFIIDPEVWSAEEGTDPAVNFLVHNEISDCTINLASEPPPGELLQLYPRIIGRQGWLIEGYEENTFYIHQDLRLDLSINEDDDCILDQVTVLADVVTEDEFNGAPARTPAVQPTQRPAPEGFTCEDALDTRLAVGDRALIIAGTLWLRSEPRVDEETEIRFFQQYTPIEIQINNGPECVEESVFWEVTVSELGEGGETYTGWMAESGGEIYFVDVWYLGW